MSANGGSNTQGQGLTKFEWISIITTVVLLVLLAILSWISAVNNWIFTLAMSVGGLGGLVHEIAQSGGKILFFQKQKDGMYLGTISGIVLGAVAGLLTIRGFLPSDGSNATTDMQIIYEVFLAGLALKGVVEAAGGTTVSN